MVRSKSGVFPNKKLFPKQKTSVHVFAAENDGKISLSTKEKRNDGRKKTSDIKDSLDSATKRTDIPQSSGNEWMDSVSVDNLNEDIFDREREAEMKRNKLVGKSIKKEMRPVMMNTSKPTVSEDPFFDQEKSGDEENMEIIMKKLLEKHTGITLNPELHRNHISKYKEILVNRNILEEFMKERTDHMKNVEIWKTDIEQLDFSTLSQDIIFDKIQQGIEDTLSDEIILFEENMEKIVKELVEKHVGKVIPFYRWNNLDSYVKKWISRRMPELTKEQLINGINEDIEKSGLDFLTLSQDMIYDQVQLGIEAKFSEEAILLEDNMEKMVKELLEGNVHKAISPDLRWDNIDSYVKRWINRGLQALMKEEVSSSRFVMDKDEPSVSKIDVGPSVGKIDVGPSIGKIDVGPSVGKIDADVAPSEVSGHREPISEASSETIEFFKSLRDDINNKLVNSLNDLVAFENFVKDFFGAALDKEDMEHVGKGEHLTPGELVEDIEDGRNVCPCFDLTIPSTLFEEEICAIPDTISGPTDELKSLCLDLAIPNSLRDEFIKILEKEVSPRCESRDPRNIRLQKIKPSKRMKHIEMQNSEEKDDDFIASLREHCEEKDKADIERYEQEFSQGVNVCKMSVVRKPDWTEPVLYSTLENDGVTTIIEMESLRKLHRTKEGTSSEEILIS